MLSKLNITVSSASPCSFFYMFQFSNRLRFFEIFFFLIRFNENIITDPGHVDIFPASRIPKKLHHLTKPIYHPSSSERGLRIVTEPNTLCSILQMASDAEVPSNLNFTRLENKSYLFFQNIGKHVLSV